MKDCRRTLLDEFVKLSKDWDNNNMLYNSLMFSKLYPGDVENSVADASLMPEQSDEKMRNDIMTSWGTPTKIFLLGNKKELMQKSRKEFECYFVDKDPRKEIIPFWSYGPSKLANATDKDWKEYFENAKRMIEERDKLKA